MPSSQWFVEAAKSRKTAAFHGSDWSFLLPPYRLQAQNVWTIRARTTGRNGSEEEKWGQHGEASAKDVGMAEVKVEDGSKPSTHME